MRISRLYYKDNLTVGFSVKLDARATHYLAHVLRLNKGNEVVLFNGDVGDVLGTITSIRKKEITISLDKIIAKPLVSCLYIHLGLAISKGESMDYAIQKSVELGVNEVTPLFSEFCEVKFKESKREKHKLHHWQKVAVSACEQSGAHAPPHIYPATKFESFIQRKSSRMKLILDLRARKKISDINQGDEIEMLVGPEGGFSDREISFAKKQGYKPVHLGPRVLRAETAPIAAIAILQSKYGNW